LLKSHGIELTDHRKRVFNVISGSSKALTPKVILDQIHRHSTMDKVTLYRILDLFVNKKVLRRIAGQTGQVYYEVVCEAHRPVHSHFICRECGDIECLNDLLVKELKAKLKPHARWADNDIDLKLEGICGECKKH
jgi:Fur family ferric uptake transcriptional regulator